MPSVPEAPSTVPPPRLAPDSSPPLQAPTCPVCLGGRAHYSFSQQDSRVLQCAGCNFTFRSAMPPANARGHERADELARRFGGLPSIVAQLLPTETHADLQIVDWQPGGEVRLTGRGAIAISAGQLDATASPLPSLTALRAQLAPGDRVLFVQADIRHAGAAVGSAEWERLVGQRAAYLDTSTALTVLYRAGFRTLGVQRLRRRVSLDEVATNPGGDLVVPVWRRNLLRLLPAALRRQIQVEVPVSEVAILATPRPPDAPAISVIVPVYNEANFVGQLLDAVLRVEFAGAPIEVVIVESNSTDGSRAIVERYATHPRVRCIFEDRPRGKGHATRTGLAQARGDLILIQDADLEYDIEDYHSLIEPILAGHESFMLGSRHGGRKHWKLRQFGKPLLSKFYNLAHVLVTGYINLLFGLRLRDPQTMYKVCRRDCVEGVSFHANYFNFDYELLLKIVRRGYQPSEVPVNYRSRSHAEGKKIRMWRDAPLGLWMITKLRLTPLKKFLARGGRID